MTHSLEVPAGAEPRFAGCKSVSLTTDTWLLLSSKYNNAAKKKEDKMEVRETTLYIYNIYNSFVETYALPCL